MGERLVAGAGQVQVPKGLVVEQTEVVGAAALGRDVDVARLGEGRGGDPEHLLLEDPSGDVFGDCFPELAHFYENCKFVRNVV